MSMSVSGGDCGQGFYLQAQQAHYKDWATAVPAMPWKRARFVRDAGADAKAYPCHASVCHSAGGPIDCGNSGDMTDD